MPPWFIACNCGPNCCADCELTTNSPGINIAGVTPCSPYAGVPPAVGLKNGPILLPAIFAAAPNLSVVLGSFNNWSILGFLPEVCCILDLGVILISLVNVFALGVLV